MTLFLKLANGITYPVREILLNELSLLESNLAKQPATADQTGA